MCRYKNEYKKNRQAIKDPSVERKERYEFKAS